jgi:hypothetical protein
MSFRISHASPVRKTKSAAGSTLDSPSPGMSIPSGLSETPIVLPGLGGESYRSLGFDFADYPFVQQPHTDSLNPSLNFHWESVSRGPIFETAFETAAQLTYHAAGRSAFFFEMTEAYLGTSKSLGNAQLKVGRKLEHWNHLDERWQFGIWQPRFRWDFIRPETVGLLGASFSVTGPAFEWVVLGSPGFIPERGVPISVENGEVMSRSPWFLPPPKKVKFLEEVTAVEYSMVLPSVQEIVQHAGASTMVRLGEQKGIWASVAYAYKPMNQLLLAYDGYLQLDSKADESAVATIFPRVLYHHLTSLEVGYNHPSFSSYFSMLYERPVRDAPPSQWTTQEVTSALGVSPTMDVIIGGTEADPSRVEVSYLRVWGGNARDGGELSDLGGKAGSAFESRYPFDNAFRLALKSNLGGISPALKRIRSHSQFLGDITNQGYIFSTELRYQARSNWELALGADLLGSNLPVGGPDKGANFIGRYRNNDRVHAGITYVF